jgi:hypothetical protein
MVGLSVCTQHSSKPLRIHNKILGGKKHLIWTGLLNCFGFYFPLYLGEVHKEGSKLNYFGSWRLIRTLPRHWVGKSLLNSMKQIHRQVKDATPSV